MSFWTWLRSPVNRRGQLMDLLVFLASLFLLGPFARLLGRLGAGFTANDDRAARQLALIILAAFVFYTVGAMLKRAALHERVKSLPNPGYAGCLFLGWISLHMSLSVLGAAAIAASFNAAPKWVPLILMIVLSTLPTFFVARVVFRPKRLEQIAAWRRSWPMEILADLMIVGAVIMLTIMWDIWIAELFTGTWKGQTFGDRLFAAGMSVGAFAFFYLSPRFLFLIEDFNRRLTWATIGLTVAPLIGRILLGDGPAR